MRPCMHYLDRGLVLTEYRSKFKSYVADQHQRTNDVVHKLIEHDVQSKQGFADRFEECRDCIQQLTEYVVVLDSDSVERHEELKSAIEQYQSLESTNQFVSGYYIRERRISRVSSWSLLTKIMGLKLGVIRSENKEGDSWNFRARWPLKLPFRLGCVITAHTVIRGSLLSLPTFGLRPQSTVSTDSAIIKACQTSDVPWLQGILETRQGHPNDRTPDDLTVFRVGRKSVGISKALNGD